MEICSSTKGSPGTSSNLKPALRSDFSIAEIADLLAQLLRVKSADFTRLLSCVNNLVRIGLIEPSAGKGVKRALTFDEAFDLILGAVLNQGGMKPSRAAYLIGRRRHSLRAAGRRGSVFMFRPESVFHEEMPHPPKARNVIDVWPTAAVWNALAHYTPGSVNA